MSSRVASGQLGATAIAKLQCKWNQDMAVVVQGVLIPHLGVLTSVLPTVLLPTEAKNSYT